MYMDEELEEIMEEYDIDEDEAEELREFSDTYGLDTDDAKSFLDLFELIPSTSDYFLF